MPYRRDSTLFGTRSRLETLIAISEAGAITEAARRLGMNQGTMSTFIARLEEKAGTQLFERKGRRGVRATAAGAVAVDRARAILREMDEAEEAVRRVRDLVREKRAER